MQDGPLQRYRQMVVGGDLAPDTAQELGGGEVAAARHPAFAIRRAGPRQIAAIRAAAEIGAGRALSLQRGRARQDHAARPVLRLGALRAEAPRSFPGVAGYRRLAKSIA